jgi:signal transduction histidine kinase
VFHSFARRLTGWYVVSAVVMVVGVLAAFAIVGLVAYVRMVQDGIDADAREAQAFSVRAALRGDHFQDAAAEFENRLQRPGIRMIATGPFPRTMPDAPRPLSPRATSAPLLIRPARGDERRVRYQGPAPGGERTNPPAPEYIFVNGKRVFGDPREIRNQGSRIGFALGTALGAHFQRVDLVDGDLRIMPDPDATLRVALWLLTGVLSLGALAGLLGWFLGRFITSQVLRPLVDVTHALQRFATRDFTPQPIAVAGKSEFDAIAVAYNAAAAQVASAFAERQQAESQMRQFVADAGHELRTPLTIVLGYIDLLRRKADTDERSRRIFSSIGIEGARMRTLIDNLVLLARMEGADVRPPEPFELCPLLEEMVEARRLLHPGRRIELDCRAEATVIGNEAEIREAIANVVDNAIKYAPDAPIRVASDAVDGGVEVTVADEGPGIHPGDRDAIFDRFYRGATRGDVEGSGLGLAIAKRALERAGGSLVLVDTSPVGTTFALRLRADRVRKREPRPATA